MSRENLVLMNPANQYDDDPIFFDLKERKYRKVMYCSICGVRCGCLCYDEYEDALNLEDSLLCGKKECFIEHLMYEADGDDILLDSGTEFPRIPINECTEEETEELMKECEDIFSCIESCEDDGERQDYLDELKCVVTRHKKIHELSADEINEIYDILSDADLDYDLNGSFC